MNTKSKKLNMITIGILAIVFLFTASMANAALVHLDPIAQTVDPGDAVLMSVKGGGFLTGVSSGSILLNWDPDFLLFNGITAEAPLIEFTNVLEPGLATVDFSAGLFSGAVGLGGVEFTFANLDFTALAPPGTNVGVGVGSLGPWQDGTEPVALPIPDADITYQGATVTITGNPVPIPGAAWLLGSGLLGLVGIVRRRAA